MLKNFKISIFLLITAFMAYGALTIIGCSSSKYELGKDEDVYGVKAVKVMLAGKQVKSVDGVKVNDHLIVEGRALNAEGNVARDSSVTMVSTDEKIVKILNNYSSYGSYYSVVRGESQGTAEILVTSGPVTVPLTIGVGNESSTNRPYLKFRNVSSDPIKVGASRDYIADYMTGTTATAETSLVWSLPDELVAKIASTGKNNATVTGVSTGEVVLFVRDAANTAAAAILLKVN